MTRKVKRPDFKPTIQVQGNTLREVQIGMGLPPVEQCSDEIEQYMDVLLGRVQPPKDFGDLTLMEYADAFFARAAEIQYLILKAEREGGVFKGSKYYRFRTGELRTFLELAKRAADLGSRRLTQARMEFELQREAQDLDFSSM